MSGVGEHESYSESRLRERRLQAYPHWDEILVRLHHRWSPDHVIRWHQQQYPGDPCPPKTTLFRYLKSKPPGWFISRLILAESGTKTARNQLVAERQSEMIESQVMRLAAARQFEATMNGLLIPEVSRNYELLDRMLTNHFRVLQEMGMEPKHGSMAPTGTPAAESGSDVMKLAIKRIVELPKEEFLPLLHEMYRKEYELHRYKAEAAEALSAVPRVIEGQGRRVEPPAG